MEGMVTGIVGILLGSGGKVTFGILGSCGMAGMDGRVGCGRVGRVGMVGIGGNVGKFGMLGRFGMVGSWRSLRAAIADSMLENETATKRAKKKHNDLEDAMFV
ncbi:hypothetical protein LINPERHAP1_LOCUS7197 [Linum perenne]